jgi:oryzin
VLWRLTDFFCCAQPSSTELIIDGLEWAVQNITRENRQGQSVISMNLSGQKSDALNLAVRNAYLNGILSVVPAGNEGIRADLRSPASELTAITVAASQENNERALFSNWGSKVDLFAAGTNVLSTYIGSPDATYSQSGTSMAAPHVAGLVLYLKAAESGLEGAAAVATRIIELTAKEILKNVPQETFNRLAFNGVEPQLGTGSSEHI